MYSVAYFLKTVGELVDRCSIAVGDRMRREGAEVEHVQPALSASFRGCGRNASLGIPHGNRPRHDREIIPLEDILPFLQKQFDVSALQIGVMARRLFCVASRFEMHQLRRW